MQNFFKKINLNKFDHTKVLKFMIVVFSFLLVFSFSNNLAKSSAIDNITGTAWGMDEGDFGYGLVRGGAEWISFNCIIDSGCGNSNYGVNYDINTGYLTGYAYSAHYGWLKFGGLKTSEMPSGSGTYTQNAQVVGGEVRGWARFCAPTANPSLCTGVHTANAKNGGWDGWLSLRGTNYGVTYNSGNKEFGGYAWGGNHGGGSSSEQVVGWVSFNCNNHSGCNDSDYKVEYKLIDEPMVTISAQDVYIPEGGQTTIFWDGLNLINAPDGCKTDGSSVNTGAWLTPNTKNSPSGTFNTGVLNTKGDYVYKIQCKDINFALTGLWSNIATVTVHVGIRLFLFPDSFVTYGPNFEVDLSWYSDAPLSDLVPPDQGYCVAEYRDSFTAPNDPPTGYWKTGNFGSITSLQTENNFSIANISAPVRFDLKCFDGSDAVYAPPVFVNKGYNESLTFSNTKVIWDPVDSRYETILKWTVVGMKANSCVPTSNPNNSSWQTPSTKDSSDGPHEEAEIEVPVGNNKYTITCTGDSNKTYSITLDINPNSGKQTRKYKEN